MSRSACLPMIRPTVSSPIASEDLSRPSPSRWDNMVEIHPRLRRDLEFIPVLQGSNQFVLIRDPLGLVPEGRALPAPLYSLAILLDGSRSLRDVQMLLMRQQGGTLVSLDQVESLLGELESAFILDSEAFRREEARIIREFSELSVRPCSHCGASYPKEPSALSDMLSGIMAGADFSEADTQTPLALVAPHIDISVGAKAYARAYGLLKGATPSRVLIMGVGHQMRDALFSLTEKDFETPLGTVVCDRELVRELREAGGPLVAAHDFHHRAEHSIEFQVLFLQHVLGGGTFRIVPILCGPLQATPTPYSRDGFLELAQGFLSVLREVLRKDGPRTLPVAGVDLCHVGPKFGHEVAAQSLEEHARHHDETLLDALCRLDPDAFWAESTRVEDRFNVCGFGALACLLEVLPPCRGTLLHYDMWHEEATRSAVSFAALGFSADRNQSLPPFRPPSTTSRPGKN